MVRALGSAFVAEILAAGERQLVHAPRTAALIDGWQGDRAEAALAMRFNAAIHALARRGTSPALVELYREQRGDFDTVLAATLRAEDKFISAWMRSPTQTNEVGRAAAIIAALMVAGRRFAMPFDLLELGSSAGLNLNLAHYAYDLGGLRKGDRASRVRIAPKWNGPPPPDVPIEVASARGVDLNPLDAADVATRERLLAYVFADQPARAERLRVALAIAERHPPRIDRAHAAPWLADRMREPQAAGSCRVLFHSMVLQYLDAAERRTVIETLADAGRRAVPRRPLVWIRFEWTSGRREVELLLTVWPGGKTARLAICHPYGAAIDWCPVQPWGLREDDPQP